jgi:hypothetical protein
MKVFNRKSQFQRMLETVGDAIDVPAEIKRLSGPGSNKAVRTALLTVGGLAGLTAGSAGISSLRDRRGAGDDS